MCSHKHKSEKKREKKRNKQTKAKHHQQDKHMMKQTKKHMKKVFNNISFGYHLFLYRQELRRSCTDFSYLRLSRAKIMLTNELIAKNMRNYSKLCSVDDLKVLSREVQFKKRLRNQVERLEQFRALGLTDVVLNGKRTVL